MEERGDVLGQNFCLSEFQAAVLIDRLDHLDSDNELRRKNAELLCLQLDHFDGVTTFKPQENWQETYFNYLIKIDSDLLQTSTLRAFGVALSAELNIQITPVYRPLNRHRLYNPSKLARVSSSDLSDTVWGPNHYNLPNADKANRCCLAVPHPLLMAEASEHDDITYAIDKVIRNAKELYNLVDANPNASF